MGATARGGEIAVFGISLQNSVQKQPARVEGPEEIQGACPGCGLRGLRTSTNCRGHRGGAKPAIWIGWRTPGPKASANRRRLCHPDGIAAGPRSPVEGPGRRGPGSRDAYQSKGLVTSVPGEPPRDGRGHRRRVGTAATPAIRTDVDPVAGAPAPAPASSFSSCSSCRSPPASHDARPPSPMTPLPPIHARGARRRPSVDFTRSAGPSRAPRRLHARAVLAGAPAPGSRSSPPDGFWTTASRGLASLPVPPSRRRAAAHTQE